MNFSIAVLLSISTFSLVNLLAVTSTSESPGGATGLIFSLISYIFGLYRFFYGKNSKLVTSCN